MQKSDFLQGRHYYQEKKMEDQTISSLFFRMKNTDNSFFHKILLNGFEMKVQIGCSVKELLCDQQFPLTLNLEHSN